MHRLDARQVLRELVALAGHEQLFLLGVVRELTTFFAARFELLELADLLLDRLEVGQHATEPTLRDEHATTTFGFITDDGGELALGADEEDVLTAQDDFAHELLRELDLAQRLLQIDDVNAIALGENEPAHLGVPTTGLVTEVNARGEQLLEGRTGHAFVLMLSRPLFSAPGATAFNEIETSAPAPGSNSVQDT